MAWCENTNSSKWVSRWLLRHHTRAFAARARDEVFSLQELLNEGRACCGVAATKATELIFLVQQLALFQGTVGLSLNIESSGGGTAVGAVEFCCRWVVKSVRISGHCRGRS